MFFRYKKEIRSLLTFSSSAEKTLKYEGKMGNGLIFRADSFGGT